MVTIEDKLRLMVAQCVGVKQQQITPEAKLVFDLGFDSLDTIDITMALEEEFDIDIEDKEVEKLVTFGDVVNFICAKTGKAASAIA